MHVPAPSFGLRPPSLSSQQPELPLKPEPAPHPVPTSPAPSLSLEGKSTALYFVGPTGTSPSPQLTSLLDFDLLFPLPRTPFLVPLLCSLPSLLEMALHSISTPW